VLRVLWRPRLHLRESNPTKCVPYRCTSDWASGLLLGRELRLCEPYL